MQAIFLIGFMGCGKSTLGRALAATTGLQFIDLDTYIERRFHANIRDIFRTEGEEAFRLKERNMLREVSQFEDVIVACGGGTPCFFDNMEVMNSAGLTVWLQASRPVLHRRLSLGRYKRPLIASMTGTELDTFIADSLEKRTPSYGKSAHTFCSDRLEDKSQIQETVTRFIHTYGLPTNQGTATGHSRHT